MLDPNGRPRSTRTAIFAVVVSTVGVIFAALTFSAKPAVKSDTSQINSDATPSIVASGNQAPSFQAGRDINVGRDLNILPQEKLPDESLIITRLLSESKNDIEELAEAPSIAEYCPKSLASLENVTSSDIPLTIGEYESDAGTLDIGVVPANAKIRYKMPEYHGRFIIYNTTSGNPYFFFNIKKC